VGRGIVSSKYSKARFTLNSEATSKSTVTDRSQNGDGRLRLVVPATYLAPVAEDVSLMKSPANKSKKKKETDDKKDRLQLTIPPYCCFPHPTPQDNSNGVGRVMQLEIALNGETWINTGFTINYEKEKDKKKASGAKKK
jgi:hypothetical protein